MAAKPFVVAPQDYAPALNLVGEHITVLASGEATEGYEIFLQRGPEGSGPPPHSHPWDDILSSSRARSLRHRRRVPYGVGGTLVHFPAGNVHWFRFGRAAKCFSDVTACASKMFADLARKSHRESRRGKLAEVAPATD